MAKRGLTLIFAIFFFSSIFNLSLGQKKEDENSKLEKLKTQLRMGIEKKEIINTYKLFDDLEEQISAYSKDDDYSEKVSRLLQFQREKFDLDLNYELAKKRLDHSLGYFNYLVGVDNSVDFDRGLIEVKNYETTIKYLSNLQFSNSLIKKLNGYSGKSEVELNLNNNESNRQVVAGIGFNLKNGLFPGEFKMNGGLNFVQNEKSLSETISNISVSYDRHLKIDSADPLRWETYAFISRYGNSFIGLEQRWETGTGIILNQYSKMLTENGTENEIKIDSAIANIKLNNSGICQCLIENNEDNAIVAKLTEEPELRKSKAQLEKAKQINRKKYAKTRYGVLLGLLTEIESYKLKGDSIFAKRQSGVDTSIVNNVVFESTPRFRLAIRPFVEWKIYDGFSISINSYIFLPLDVEAAKVDPLNTINKEGKDIRLDIQFSAELKVSESASLVVSTRYHYDARPPGQFLDVKDINSSFLASPVQSHFMTRVKFGYKFL